MSSHREAPEISKDPVADSTDVYAFVSPDQPDTVTLIANYIPFQKPDGGPNFFEFGDDVRYEINIANAGRAEPDVTYRFEFTTKIRDKTTFLYNTGPIHNITDTTWNRPQYYTVTKVVGGVNGVETVLGRNLTCPPVNVGVRSTPDYATLGAQAVHPLRGGGQVFAGQRADAFHVDLGSVFDLAGLRPFNPAHLIPLAAAPGMNGLQSFNVHTIAIQVPKSEVVNGAVPTDPTASNATIGVWTTASRQTSRVFDTRTATFQGHGPWQQISRLANPLFNEVLVPMAQKDVWNTRPPSRDSAYVSNVDHPELGRKIPVLYPGKFPNLAAYTKPRADLDAIFLTGIPRGVVSPTFTTYTGSRKADLMRLNVAIPPAIVENSLGVIGGDVAGFPNGRRLGDDVTTIEVRALAGLTIPLVDPSYVIDAPAAVVTDGSPDSNSAHLKVFPYLGLPGGGYETVPGTTSAAGVS